MNKLIETRFGTMECLEADSVVSRSLALYGEWAQAELSLLQGLVRPGDTVLDVGAFIGTHTLAFARMVGAAGSVHSFEPRKDIRSILAANIQRNELAQVVVHDCALGDIPGEVNIQAVDTEGAQNFGGLAIEAIESISTNEVESISLKTLASFDFKKLDLLKIDAEGMEARVIAGGIALISRLQPLIFAECNDLQNGTDTLRAMQNLGYSIYGYLSEAFNPLNFRGETENRFGSAAEVSLLGVPPSRIDTVVHSIDLTALAPIRSIDDLALLLLHKPQYPDEAWGKSEAAAVLGLQFESPRSRLVNAQLDAVVAMNADFNARLQEILQQTITNSERCLRVEADLRARVIALENAYRGSFTFRCRQFLGRTG